MKTINKLLNVTDEDIADVRKMYNKSEESIKEDLNILKEWLAKQHHLPQNYDENRLERILLRNKFRIEQSKLKLDSYFTLRGMYPDFFQNTDPDIGFDQIRKAIVLAPMPVLTNNKERLFIWKFYESGDQYYSLKSVFEYLLAMADLELTHDYAAHTRFLIDYKHFSMAHYKKLDVNVLIKGLSLYQGGYSERMICLDFINPPAFMSLIMNLLKLAMTPNLYNKIKIHNSLDSIHEVIRTEYLPSEYGGQQRTTEEIHEEMGKMWKEELHFLAENGKKVSNEKLRIGKPYNVEEFGTDGTFKKINLD